MHRDCRMNEKQLITIDTNFVFPRKGYKNKKRTIYVALY